MAVFQQTFLGASITNFSTNLGFGSNSSTMNINLVGDDENVRGLSNGKSRLVNGVREGYSYDSDASINLFPIDLWKDLNNRFAGGITDITKFKNNIYNQGDFFWAPPAGSPVFFSYFDNKRWYDFQNPANGNNVNSPDRQYLRDRWGAASLSFGGILKSMEKQWDAGTGVTYSVTLEDPRSILEGTQVVLSDSIAITSPPDQDLQIFFDVGGVQRKLNRGFNGAYNVLNPFGYYELRHDPSQTIFPNKYPFSYNTLGIAGVVESGFPWMKAQSRLAASQSGQHPAAGVPDFYDYKHGHGVQYALESMLGGWNATYFQRGEPFGGGLFYGQVNSLMYNNTPGLALSSSSGLPDAPFNKDSTGAIGTHAYRFAVDLTDLRKLNEAMNPSYLTNTLDFNGNRKMYWGGTIPNNYHLQGQSMSLLHLIQEVCKTAGADFFVTLLPGCFINHSNDDTPISPWYNGSRLLDKDHNYYSGVIKINVIQRNREVNVGVISQTIHDATENHKGPWAADSIDCLALKKADCLGVKGFRSRCEWNDQITKCQSKGGVTQANIGKEFTDAVSNIIMYGGARSRIVGVTPIGAAKKRKEIFVDQDNSYLNHCWNLSEQDCANHRTGGFSDCRWNSSTSEDSSTGYCTGFGEQDPYFIEYLPNIELDGVTLQGSPADESVDSSYGISNDNYINWHWHRHQPIWDGGINTQGTDSFPHDINALNSVSAIGSTYSCSYSFDGPIAGRNRVSSSASYEVLTRDAGYTNIDSCINYLHYGRCSDDLAVTKTDCLANNDPAEPPAYHWIVEEWKDPKGLCGKKKCTWNSCTIGATEYAAPSQSACVKRAAAEGAAFTYTPDYTEDTYDEESCGRFVVSISWDGTNSHSGESNPTGIGAPHFYIEETLPNVSERYCKWFDFFGSSSVESYSFVPNHWNHGDGFIDLFPMWGFDSADLTALSPGTRPICDDGRWATEADCVAHGSIWHNPQGLIMEHKEGDPILGIFNDDDPYRDSDESDGIGSPFSYFNRWQGSCYSFGPHPSHTNAPGAPGVPTIPRPQEIAGHVYETKDGVDVAQCLDMTLHNEAHWISYCNNYMPSGGGAGDAFSPGMTVHTKVHQHSCNQCILGGIAVAARDEFLCTARLGVWTEAFPRIKGNVLKMKSECNALPNSHWEIQFQDPLTKLKPIFDTFKSTVATDSEYTSCELRDFPSDIENITVMARNIGYCDVDADAEASPGSYSPEDCQTMLGPFFVLNGVSTGAGNPAIWDGSWDSPSKPTGSSVFGYQWVSKDGVDDKSFLYSRPATATIPIYIPDHLVPAGSTNFYGGAGFSSSNIYHATVTELRHAADGFESWISYLYNFDPFLLCEMGWQECPETPHSGTHSTAMRNVMGQVLIPTWVALPGAGRGVTGRAFSEAQKEEFTQMEVYNLVRSIVNNNYGLTYLMPLPMTPRISERCSILVHIPDKGDFELNKEECIENKAEWGYSGYQNEWSTDWVVDMEEDRWDIASSAWTGDSDTFMDSKNVHTKVSYHSTAGHVRHPEHPNFWTDDGNCESFVTYPRLETQRLKKLSVDINFTNIDPESMWSLPAYTNGNLGGKTQGKAFVKASVDAETYWLQAPDSKWNCYETANRPSGFDTMDETACIAAGGVWMNGSCQLDYRNGIILGKHASEKSCRDNGGFWQENSPLSENTFFKPYALIRVVSPAFYEKNDTIKVRDDFVGCKDPFRFKVGMGTRKRGHALGVCVDKRAVGPPRLPAVPLGLDDKKVYADPHREHMDEGYGCHYKGICRDEIVTTTHFRPPLAAPVVTSKIVFRRVLENGRKPIQDEATCIAQPSKFMFCAGIGQDGVPEWAPEKVCEVMTNSTGLPTSDGKWLPAGLAECEDIPLREEKNGFIVTEFTRDAYKFEFIALGEGYQYINVPLEATKKLASASTARAVLGNILLGELNPISATLANKQKMAAARYKPWYAGVPQQSNRFTWGPWGQASNFGKAEVIFDDSYHPGAFGATGIMNSAAMSKIGNSINAGAYLENENGSVTISGLPEYKMGSPMQLYMVSGFSDINTPAIGPYITDIAIDIGPDGVSTTYRMQTQRSFGDLSSIYENALHNIAQDQITGMKKSADATKEMRRVDMNSNQRVTRTPPP